MKPIINVEDEPGKTVGRRVLKDTLALKEGGKAEMEAWRKAFKCGGYPKGVFRFKTHEEADEWWLTARAKNREKKS